jgi:hypothetical protein
MSKHRDSVHLWDVVFVIFVITAAAAVLLLCLPLRVVVVPAIVAVLMLVMWLLCRWRVPISQWRIHDSCDLSFFPEKIGEQFGMV